MNGINNDIMYAISTMDLFLFEVNAGSIIKQITEIVKDDRYYTCIYML